MAGSFTAKVSGLDELRAALRALPPNLRRRALRNALSAGARAFRDEARRLTPVLKLSTLSGASAFKRGVRRPGTLRNAIRVRTSKQARRAGDVGVFVNVRPAKGADRGSKSPNDPFYWRFVEFGTAKKPQGARMLQLAAVNKAGEALRRIEQTLGPQIQRLNTPRAR